MKTATKTLLALTAAAAFGGFAATSLNLMLEQMCIRDRRAHLCPSGTFGSRCAASTVKRLKMSIGPSVLQANKTPQVRG